MATDKERVRAVHPDAKAVRVKPPYGYRDWFVVLAPDFEGGLGDGPTIERAWEDAATLQAVIEKDAYGL
jgi:hypothetical protein